MEVYPDPLRKGGKQAAIWIQLVCAFCNRELSKDGIIDLRTSKAFCCVTHYEQRLKQ
jgi:hypothetical protein